jgi:hypothetical protein
MGWIGWLTVGFFIGGIFGVIMMAIMSAGSKADDQNLGVRQYEEN